MVLVNVRRVYLTIFNLIGCFKLQECHWSVYVGRTLFKSGFWLSGDYHLNCNRIQIIYSSRPHCYTNLQNQCQMLDTDPET